MATLPIFYTNKEQKLHNNLGRELIEKLVNQELELYHISTEVNDINVYGESKSEVYLYDEPITIKCRVSVSDVDIELDGGRLKIGRGDIAVHIYLEHLQELGNPEIKIGDFLKYLEAYYEIVDAGYGKYNIQRFLGGDRRFYRTLLANRVPKAKFDGK